MRFVLVVLIIFITQTFAKINITTFSSRFVQKITNDQNRTITYEGVLYYKAPKRLLWRYTKPLFKTVLVEGDKVTIIEPELEQILIKKRQNEDLFAAIRKAKRVGKDRYEVQMDGVKFTIFMRKGKLERIVYKDRFGNRNEVLFLNPKQNEALSDSLFSIKLNPDYDIIYQ